MDRATLVEQARQSIARGSKSFALASRLFERETRERVWLLYAWCRACDDLADAQDMGGELGDQSGAAERLAAIRRLTDQALAGTPTGNFAFDGFAIVARECGLTRAMADDVIAGFALDAAGWRPRTETDTLRYCYHVAGAVGVMMAVVMGVASGDEDTLDRACDLGLAFQLANIARDVAEDDAAGRCYLPAQWLDAEGIAPGGLMAPCHRPALVRMVRRLCELERGYEASARVGAARLAFRQRLAILAAGGIYGAIARKVEAAGSQAWDRRAFTSSPEKLRHVLGALWQAMSPPPPATRPGPGRRDLMALARAQER